MKKNFGQLSFVLFTIFLLTTPIFSQRVINERFVYHALRQIHSAQITFQSTIGSGNYAGSLQLLADSIFIDQVLADGIKYGYRFEMTVNQSSSTQPAFFKVTAVPRQYPRTGRRSFYIDLQGIIHGADRNGAAATKTDPIVLICGGNERETIQSLHVVLNAQATYQSTTGNGAFGSLSELHKYGLIDYLTSRGESCGYNLTLFTANRTSNLPASFYVTAVPKQYPITGRRSFYIDQSGIIRGADRNGQSATADDPPIEF